MPCPHSILDPLYGLIRLTDDELRIIDTPIFQRLRGIRQNALLHLVFPAATHSRFEHSLGALAMADALLESIALNSQAAGNKVAPAEVAEPGQAIAWHTLQAPTLKFLFEATRLAALVHDLGHGPLSHTFDAFAPKTSDVMALLQTSPLDHEMQQTLLRLAVQNGRHHGEGDRVTHEFMSCVFFSTVWYELHGSDKAKRRLWRAVIGAVAGHNASDMLAEDAPWVPFIHDLISSSPIDVDRMDYLQRDSGSSGVKYGLFDRGRLLKAFLCYRSQQGDFRLGIKLSGFRAVENFAQARFELFVQVYFHRTNRAIDVMLQQIATLAQATSVVDCAGFASLMHSYTELTDEHFLQLLRGKRASPIAHARIHTIADAIGQRSLWKIVYQDDPVTSRIDLVKEALRKRYPEVTLYEDSRTPPDPIPLDDSGTRMLRRSPTGIYTMDGTLHWARVSPIFEALLSDRKHETRRLFVEPLSHGQLEAMRDTAYQAARRGERL